MNMPIKPPIWWPFLRFSFVVIMVALGCIALLKEHKKVEEQQTLIRQQKSEAAKHEATASELKKDVGVLTAQLKEQALQIQKVSAQVQIREPLARGAHSNR